MAFEDLKEDVSDSQRAAREYIDSTGEYYKLRTFKFVMQVINALILVLFLGTLGILSLLFISTAASIKIGQSLDSMAQGFLIVGGIYLLLGLLAYAIRGRLESSVIKKFSKYFFEEK